MRAFVLVMLGACSTSHAVTADRTDCNGCHASEYEAAPQIAGACTPTDHVALGYPRTCSNCHGTTSWCPADASHTKFDLTSTSHAGWDCADCHVSITYDPPHIDEQPIDCIGCHWHDQARTDAIHLGNGDYTWAPDSCLRCHLGGRQ